MLTSKFVSPAVLVIFFSLYDVTPKQYNVKEERFILASGFGGFYNYEGEGGSRTDYSGQEVAGEISPFSHVLHRPPACRCATHTQGQSTLCWSLNVNYPLWL